MLFHKSIFIIKLSNKIGDDTSMKGNYKISDETKIKLIDPFLKTLKQESTQKDYLLSIESFANLTQKNLLKITSKDAQLWKKHLEEKAENKTLKYSTALKKFRHLSSLYHYAARNNIAKNPFTQVTMEEAEPVIRYVKLPSITEIDSVLTLLKSKHDFSLLLTVLLSFKCMMTISEICNLKLSDFFQTADGDYYFHIRPENTWTEARYCYLPEDVAKIVFQMFPSDSAQATDPYLISNRKGGKPCQQTLRKRLERLCIRNQMTFHSFNDYRNAGIALAYSNSGNVRLIASSIGLRTNAHINRLSSLKLEQLDAANYINVFVKNL